MSSRKIPCSLGELLAVFISREIKDGEGAVIGRNLPVPLAGAVLAHLHHGPNIKFGFGHVMANVFVQPVVDFSALDWHREIQWAESYRPEDRTMISLKHLLRSIFFIGGIQVDKFGNANMIAVGKNYKSPSFRGPGAIGAPSLTTYMSRYYIFLNHHTKRVLVDQCDYVSCLGWGNGESDVRKRLGIPGGGPKFCITPLCIMDFDDKTKHMRLKYLHPGVTVERVLENTGFDLIVPDEVETTPQPTDDELEILRMRVDPNGLLRLA